MIIAVILWVLIWGLAGYFTVRAIQIHVQSKRWERYMKARAMHYRNDLMRRAKNVNIEITDNPFETLV
jgi:divalent metal cation (Fe/Co/Zn/Cd) transporter